MINIKQKSPWIKDIKIKAIDIVKNEFFGNTPPTVFVGSKLYPKVNVGILSPLENKEEAKKYDDPIMWFNENYSLQKIFELRSNLINSRFRSHIFDVKKDSKFLELAQEISMSFKPTSIEVQLREKLRPKISVDNFHLPFGPSGEIKKIEATENIKLDKNVEKVFYDTDLKSADALKYLNTKGFNENQLSQLLSIGVTGIKVNRKLVPTKWSITATDDLLGKDIIKEIKNYDIIKDYRLYFGNYFGNYYLIFLFPEAWSYELFESAMPDYLMNKGQEVYTTTDYESYYGRKDYADNTVGGYYAARLAVLEHLKILNFQGSALLLRFVSSEYSAPLGVFVVRQAARKTLSVNSINFDNKKVMLEYGRALILKKFKYDINNLLKRSKMLEIVNKQTRLNQFI